MEGYEDVDFAGLTEEEKIERWRLNQYLGWGLDGEVIAMLLQWGTDPREVQHLLFRDGKRTTCDMRQLLLILEPLPV